MAKQYLDLIGLQNFLTQIKDYYQDTNASEKVGYAVKAGKLAKTLEIIGPTGTSISSSTVNFADNSEELTLTLTIDEATASSSGLMSSDGYSKLQSIEEGAEENIINTIQVATVTTTVDDEIVPSYQNLGVVNKTVKIDLTPYALKSDLTTVFRFKGVKDFIDDADFNANKEEGQTEYTKLPAAGIVGDVWHVNSTGGEFVWINNHWEEIGSIISLDGYVTIGEMNTAIDNKFDPLDEKVDNLIEALDSGTKKVKNAENADKATSATTADKTKASLTVKVDKTESNNVVFDGSVAKTIDLSDFATVTQVNAKLDKPAKATGDTNTNLLQIANGGVVTDSGIPVSKFSNGAVVDGNESFVTGGEVYDTVKTFIENGAIEYEFEDGDNGSFTVSETKNGSTTTHTISTGAEKNKIDVVQVDGTALTITNKTVNITSSSFTSKGVVATNTVDTFTTSTEAATYSTDSTKIVDGKAVYTALIGDNYIAAIPTSSIQGLFTKSTT